MSDLEQGEEAYKPPLAASIVATISMSIALVLHLWQTLRYRSWTWCFTLLAICVEVVSYVFRILLSREDTYSSVYFYFQFIAILLVPTYMYWVVRQITSSIYEFCLLRGYSPILKTRFVLKFLPICQIFPFLWLHLGVFMACSPFDPAKVESKLQRAGRDFLLAGFISQSFTFLCLLVFLSELCLRTRHVVPERQQQLQISGSEAKLRLFMSKTWLITVLLLLRTLFHLVQMAGDVNTCSISRKESVFGLYDYLPVVIVIWLLAVWYPNIYPALLRPERKASDRTDRNFNNLGA